MVTIEKSLWLNTLDYNSWWYHFKSLELQEMYHLCCFYLYERDNKEILSEIRCWRKYSWDSTTDKNEREFFYRYSRPRSLQGYFKWRADLGEVAGAFNWSLSIGGCTPDPLKCLNRVISNERELNAPVLLEIKRWN